MLIMVVLDESLGSMAHFTPFVVYFGPKLALESIHFLFGHSCCDWLRGDEVDVHRSWWGFHQLFLGIGPRVRMLRHNLRDVEYLHLAGVLVKLARWEIDAPIHARTVLLLVRSISFRDGAMIKVFWRTVSPIWIHHQILQDLLLYQPSLLLRSLYRVNLCLFHRLLLAL